MKQKILFIQPGWMTRNIGGAEIQAYFLSNYLVDQTYDVSVIYKKDTNFNPYYKNELINYLNYKKFKIKIFQLIDVIIKMLIVKPDIIYTRTGSSVLRASIYILTKVFRKAKVIVAVAADDEIINLSIRKNKSITDFLHWKLFKSSDLIITQNTFQSVKLKEIVKRNAHLIPNSFPSINEKIKKKNKVVWVGNIRPVKGPEILLKALKNLNIPHDWDVLIIGKDFNNYGQEINNLKQNIKFIGPKEFTESNLHIAEARVLINTSHSEGFSNTFIQAFLQRTMVISFKVNPDYIFDKDQIGICANEDINSFIANIESAMKSIINFKPIIDRAESYATKHFSQEINYSKLIKLLKDETIS